MVKHLPAMQETWVQSLGTLAWKIPRMEEPGRLQSTGSQRVGHTEQLPFATGTPAEYLKERK